MRIVYVSDWFAEKMGYSENVLPRYLSKLGAEVHVVASDLQPAFSNYEAAYEPFIGPRQQRVGRTPLDGFTLHRLPHGSQRRGIYMKGFHRCLSEIRPDVVQCTNIHWYGTYQASVSKPVLGYRLFLEDHTHRSVFSERTGLRGRLVGVFDRVVGRMIGTLTDRCYAIAPDVADIAVRHFGMPHDKIDICSLGVDTDAFRPCTTDEERSGRRQLRQALGFSDDTVVCLYSGRFSADKNPLCLAHAVDTLSSRGVPVGGLFIGPGTPGESAAIQRLKNCRVHPFVEYAKLPAIYQAADLGVWPTQESTSQLDAASAGLPLILSSKITVLERVQGNGLLYRENDVADLAARIEQLLDAGTRSVMAEAGRKRMIRDFSWDVIAARRMDDYRAATSPRRSSR